MKDWQKALLIETATMRDAMTALSLSTAQICLVVDGERRLKGTVTDGDIRRAILRALPMTAPVSAIVNPRPRTAPPAAGRQALRALMMAAKVNHVPLVDAEGRVVGLEWLGDQLAGPAPLPNWCVLMAGGEGRRLRPLTEEIPKPLLPVGNKPILESILEHLIGHGFCRFYLSVNYKAEMVIDHFGDGRRWGAEIRYLRETRPLGTAGPLGLIAERLAEPLLVMNGDLLTTVNVARMLDFHREQGALATMAVREVDFRVPYGVVRIDGAKIVAIEEKPVQSFLCNAGLYVLAPEVLAMVPPGAELDMPELFERLIAAGRPAAVFPLRESWIDVGRLEDLERARAAAERDGGSAP